MSPNFRWLILVMLPYRKGNLRHYIRLDRFWIEKQKDLLCILQILKIVLKLADAMTSFYVEKKCLFLILINSAFKLNLIQFTMLFYITCTIAQANFKFNDRHWNQRHFISRIKWSFIQNRKLIFSNMK